MVNHETDFISEYIDWIRENSAQRIVNEYTEITTPFLDPHNDVIQFYVKRNGEEFLFTDDGYTLSDIEMTGIDLKNKKIVEIMQSLAYSMNVEIIDGAITAKALDSMRVAQTEHFMLQAMLKFNDLFMLSSPRVRSFFLDEVRDFFEENDIRSTPAVMFSGKSGLPQRFDFVIPASRTRPERMVTTLNQPSRQNVQSAIFSWNDVRESRKNSVNYLILNSKGKKNIALSTAAEQYGIQPFWWDERASFIDQFA